MWTIYHVFFVTQVIGVAVCETGEALYQEVEYRIDLGVSFMVSSFFHGPGMSEFCNRLPFMVRFDSFNQPSEDIGYRSRHAAPV